MASKRRRSDSVQSAIERAQEPEEIPVPEGISLASEDERTLWEQYTRMRAASDWRTGDLLQVHQVVRCDIEVRMLEKDIREHGFYDVNPAGERIPNPSVGMLDKWRRQKLAILRGIALNVPNDATQASRDRNNAPKVTAEKKKKTKDAASADILSFNAIT